MATELVSDSFNGILKENKNVLSEIDRLKNSPISTMKRNIVSILVGTTGLAFAFMFGMQILTGTLALITAGVIGIGGFLTLRFVKQMDPLIQQKTRNFMLEKMVEEARVNAIRQLDNHVLANAEKLANAKKARNKMGAMVENLKSKIDFLNKDNPTNKKKIEIYERVKNAYETVVKNVDNAQMAHKKFEEKVADYKELDKFTKMAGEAMALFEDGSNAKLNEMLSLESFEHIDTEFNSAIIEIENNAKDMEA